jgi:hypothetical protein
MNANEKSNPNKSKQANVLTIRQNMIYITEPHMLREYDYTFNGVFEQNEPNY